MLTRRHEWFQSANAVEIGIFVKNVKKEQVELNVQEKSVRVCFCTILCLCVAEMIHFAELCYDRH